MNDFIECLYPQVLILSSRYDFTSDYVVTQLRKKDLYYLRLNSEDLSHSSVILDPVRRRLEIKLSGRNYIITPDCLRSVLFRRPVFLRNYGDDDISPMDRFSRIQWAAFVRNLMLFEEAHWINDPVATYKAEHKAIQLSIAAQIGFSILETRVTNAPHPKLFGNVSNVAVKGLDTVLLRDSGKEMFGFTNIEDSAEFNPSDWSLAPAIIQEALTSKLDIRVTVVDGQVFAASIMTDGNPIYGDWRVQKETAQFIKYDLPKEINYLCCQLVKTLGLSFGCIDLALYNGEFYFLEINPTGEWAWLVDTAGLPIDEAIADTLSHKVKLNVG